MKILFIRNKKKKPEETPKPDLESMIKVLAIPKALIARGVLISVTEDGAEILESEQRVLEQLNQRVAVHYEPNDFKCHWRVVFMVDMTWKGQTFGIDVFKLVGDVGLVFPTETTPWVSHVEVNDTGFTWYNAGRPNAKEIRQVVEETQRQVWSILEGYAKAVVFTRAAKGAGK